MNIVKLRTGMTVRITFRGPAIAERTQNVGTEQEKVFTDLTAMTDWVAVHIPETQRGFVSLSINCVPITGATLEATPRPIPEPEAVDESEMI